MVFNDTFLSPSGMLYMAGRQNPAPQKRKKLSPSKPAKKNIYTKDDIEVYSAGEYYGRRRQEFFGTNKKFFRTGVTKDHKSWNHLLYVVYRAREIGIPAHAFIESQIWFFVKQWKTFPSPYHLTPLRGGDISPDEVFVTWDKIYGKCQCYYEPPRAAKQTAPAVDINFYEALLVKTAKKFGLPPKEVLALFGTELFSEEFLKFKLAK